MLAASCSAPMLLQLHLGCGTKHLPAPWINLDSDPDVCPNVVDDIRTLASVAPASVGAIYACHVLEHVGRREWQAVLAVWASKLASGAILRISVPDFAAVASRYLAAGNIEEVMGLVVGGQRNAADFHAVIFDAALLTAGLHAAGFHDVVPWDWRAMPHAHIDDYSQAYLPHMDKDHGMQMSLNLQATRN